MTCDNSFGKVLYSLRKEKGITQKDLADKLCVSDKAISRWEVGITRPDLEMILKISKFYKIPCYDLISARVTYDKEDSDKIVNKILEEFKNIKNKRIELIKIIGIIISFFRLIVHIIELVLFR